MARLVHGVGDTPLVLSASDNPVLIADDAVLDCPADQTDVLAPSITAPWQITNAGHVTSALYGFAILSAGTLTNAAYAVSGSVVAAAPALVANFGMVNAASYAVWLQAGGTVSNGGAVADVGAEITGTIAAVFAEGVLTVDNGATVAGTSGFGVLALADTSIVNGGAPAVISGGIDGIADLAGAISIENAGSIAGAQAFGVLAAGGAALSNAGQITGGWSGAYLTGGTSTVANTGVIAGADIAGVWLAGGGTLANNGSLAVITGALVGVVAAGGAASIDNAGSISGEFGVLLLAGGTLTNTGTITGALGVLATAQGANVADMVVDAGLIASSFGPAGTALEFLDPGATLRLLPGAAFSGGVLGDGDSTLDLAGTGGSIAGIGATFTGFALMEVEAGAAWDVGGASVIGSEQTLAVEGTLVLASGATLNDQGALFGGGTLDLGGAGDQVLRLGPTSSGGTGSTLAIPITGLGLGDRIELDGIAVAGTPTAEVGIGATGTPTSVAVLDGGGAVVFAIATIELSAGLDFATSVGQDGALVLTVGSAADAFVSIAASLADVTGPARGSLTRDPTFAGTLATPAGIVAFSASLDGGAPSSVLADVSRGGAFALTPAALAKVAGGTLADGMHDLRLVVSDAAGHVATSDVAFTLDTAPPPLSFAVAPVFTDGDAPGMTGSGTVTLTGSTIANGVVTLLATSAVATADANGSFAMPGVVLAQGANALTLRAVDLAGNVATQSGTITFAPGASAAPLLFWNQQAQHAVQLNANDPYSASRAYAMESVVVLDTLNAIRGAPGYYSSLTAPAGISPAAALAGAAEELLSDIFPGQTATFAQALAQSLSGEPAGTLTDQAVAFGRAVADADIARRAQDGYTLQGVFDGPTGVGKWQPTRPGFLPALDPAWADLTPFAMTAPSQFPAPQPPAVDSAAYETALQQVQLLGEGTSTTRTADETQIAKFWNDPPGSFTPSGHWNTIMQNVAVLDGLDLDDAAVMFADVNLAMGDSAIVGAYVKYLYDYWRPVTAIDTGDAANAADPNWVPLLITPNFPSYTSGHAIFSATAATILDGLAGPTAFSSTSSSLPGVTREYTSFDQAAQEAAISRVYGGIHWIFDSTAGLAEGKQVGSYDLGVEQQTNLDRGPFLALDQTGPFVVTTGSLALSGFAIDNVAPLTILAVSLDGAAARAVAVDASGRWSFDVGQFGTVAAGSHLLHLGATDRAGAVGTLDIRFGVPAAPAAAAPAVVDPATVGVSGLSPGFLVGSLPQSVPTTADIAAIASAAVNTVAAILPPVLSPQATASSGTGLDDFASGAGGYAGIAAAQQTALALPVVNPGSG